MFDYKLIEAMAEVVLEGGFEKAARKLHISQSAVSQRVKLLEEQAGRVLMVRGNPPAATEVGQAMLKHYQQVRSLENEVVELLGGEESHQFTSLSLGVNEDSLATWFPRAVLPVLQRESITVDLKVDDQEQTLKYLKAGEVVGCISCHDKPIQGCSQFYLGGMEYRLVCAPGFYQQWFGSGFSDKGIACAPAVIFNRWDRLHHRMLELVVEEVPDSFPIHYVPSSEQFVRWIEQGLAYGAVPVLQLTDQLEQGTLIEMAPGNALVVPLYWHVWSHRSRLLTSFTEILISQAKNCLR